LGCSGVLRRRTLSIEAEMKKLRIIDTSVFCVWLRVPGFDHCGPTHDFWDFDRIERELTQAEKEGEQFVLPLAVIIETGNHIAQSAGNRYQVAERFVDCIRKTTNNESPWVFFGDQTPFWEPQKLVELTSEWIQFVTSGSSFGDISIKKVAEYYAKTGNLEVLIFTGDAGLNAFQPEKPPLIPRRRKH